MSERAWDKRYESIRRKKKGVLFVYPDVKDEYFETDNPGIDIEIVTKSAAQKIKWRCKICGEPWEASPNNRFAGEIVRPCPKCARKSADQERRKTAAKKNGSIYYHSELIRNEWDWEKNIDLDPREISINSNYKFWWVCSKCKNSYDASAAHRCVGGTGCNECSFQAMGDRYRLNAAAKNPFGKEYPYLLKEWDYDLNEEPPENFSISSNKTAWWKCPTGAHVSYERPINKQTKRTFGCPKCQTTGTSRNELRVFCEIKSCFKDTSWRHKIFGHEVDIFIPELSIGIEYDGSYWHKDKFKDDLQKTEKLLEAGVKLIRLREFPLEIISNNCLKVPNEEISHISLMKLYKQIEYLYSEYSRKLGRLLESNDFIADEEFRTLLSRLPAPPLDQSFAEVCKDKAKYWHYEKNYPATPDLFLPRSTFKAQWKCVKDSCHHKFTDTIDAVYSRKYACPECGKKASATNRVKNKKNKITALIERPALRPFLVREALEIAERVGPGSHKVVEGICPKCGDKKRRPIKEWIYVKYLCRDCSL
tara:strand:- start:7764 stop:9365 length:1602 start_codon:yes stop_codon:yes gene_type:complete